MSPTDVLEDILVSVRMLLWGGLRVGVGVSLLVPMIALKPVDGISPNLHVDIIGTSLRAD